MKETIAKNYKLRFKTKNSILNKKAATYLISRAK